MATVRVGNKRVTLKLSVREADALATVLMYVGGPPTSHRGAASDVLYALLNQGLDGACAPVNGSVHFV